uniref:Uncharacterized protein n=1 Tax=Megaselia scalaris TaxID=36166 RepID=T1GV74_MEGSC
MVECKKAQPKEVMLPANLAKTRTAGRTAYGELVVLSGSNSSGIGGGIGLTAAATHHHHTLGAAAAAAAVAAGNGGVVPTSSIRYAPYPLPATFAANIHHHQTQQQQNASVTAVAHTLIPFAAAASSAANTPSLLQYTPQPTQPTLYDTATVMTYKRLFAAAAAGRAQPTQLLLLMPLMLTTHVQQPHLLIH